MTPRPEHRKAARPAAGPTERSARWQTAASTASAPAARSRSGTRRTRSSGWPRCEGAERLPFSLKVLLENLLRTEDGANVTAEQIRALGALGPAGRARHRDPVHAGARDHAGLHRRAVRRRPRHDARGRPRPRRRPGQDQPAGAGRAGHRPLGHRRRLRPPDAFERNVELEYERNRERYQFLRWGQTAFDEFKVVPPGTGIVHQVNIEYLARVVMVRGAGRRPTRTPASAPTRTPRWSTASACSAGASAASRPRRRCSASRCRCSSRGSSASSSPASCPRAPPRPTSC